MGAGVGAAPFPPAGPTEAAGKGVHVHDGFYLRLGVGVGSTSFTISEDFGDVDESGVGPSLELALGQTVAPGLVIGGGIYGTTVSEPEYKFENLSSTGDAATISMIGPFVDWYFDPTRGLHAEAAIGYTVIAAAKGDPYPTDDVSGSGFGLIVGAGYEAWIGEQWSLGVLGRVQYVTGSAKSGDSNDSADTSGTILSALLTTTYH